MIRLYYGRTNTFLIQGTTGNLLVDTDYAGTLYSFYKALRENSIGIQDVTWILATHYHPDHMGLISELMEKGVRLLVMDVSKAISIFQIKSLQETGFLICQSMIRLQPSLHAGRAGSF